jgi:dienelactone hydrolase
MVVFFGDADPVLPPERREELTRRFETWPIEGRLVVYPGADHVFAGSMPGRYRAEYDGDSWRIATDLLDRALENAPADDATREE